MVSGWWGGAVVGSYHFVVLYQHHVVRAKSSAEDDAGDTLETMDPFLSLGSLAAHIEHPICEGWEKKSLCVYLSPSMQIADWTWMAMRSPAV